MGDHAAINDFIRHLSGPLPAAQPEGQAQQQPPGHAGVGTGQIEPAPATMNDFIRAAAGHNYVYGR